MISADASFRWDGEQWWRWTGLRWTPDPEAEDPPAAKTDPGATDARPDVVSADRAMRYRGKTKRALAAVPAALATGEVVEFLLAADHEGRAGVLVLTDTRVFFLTNARPPTITAEVDVADISGALLEAGRLRHGLEFQHPLGPLALETVDRPAAAAFVGLVHARLAGHVLSCVGPDRSSRRATFPTRPPSQAASAAPPVPSDDPLNVGAEPSAATHVEALSQLTRMLELDLITEDEYQVKKAEILGRL